MECEHHVSEQIGTFNNIQLTELQLYVLVNKFKYGDLGIVANKMNVCVSTIKAHLQNIDTKLNNSSIPDTFVANDFHLPLLIWLIEQQIINPSSFEFIKVLMDENVDLETLLTNQELTICALLSQGVCLSNICIILNIAIDTLKNHCQSIYQKLKVDDYYPKGSSFKHLAIGLIYHILYGRVNITS